MQEKIKEYFKNVCLLTSKLSTCASKQVGSILVRDGRILGISYNGVPSGVKHCTDVFSNNFDREKHHIWSHENENHAEQNLISFCAKSGISTTGAFIIVTLSPCIHCAKLLLNCGLKKVIYLNKYDKETIGIDFLNNHGVPCISFEEWKDE